MDGLLDDACIALSILLQFGAEPAQLAASMGNRRGKQVSPRIRPIGHRKPDPLTNPSH